jgi:hypothetical protein
MQNKKSVDTIQSMKFVLDSFMDDDNGDDCNIDRNLTMVEEQNDEHNINYDFATTISNEEKKFRELVYNDLVKSRSLSLNSMKEGIQLNGTLQCNVW